MRSLSHGVSWRAFGAALFYALVEATALLLSRMRRRGVRLRRAA